MSMTDWSESELVKIKYKNYKGETSDYLVLPGLIYFGSTEFHPEEQWLMEAQKRNEDGSFVERHFAMKDILAWWVP